MIFKNQFVLKIFSIIIFNIQALAYLLSLLRSLLRIKWHQVLSRNVWSYGTRNICLGDGGPWDHSSQMLPPAVLKVPVPKVGGVRRWALGVIKL